MNQKLILTLSLLTIATIASGQTSVIDWQFDDTNGTNINVANTTGVETGSWDFGGPQVQSGALNFGYTSFYKWQSVDTNAGSTVFRSFTFSETLTTAKYSSYTFEIALSKWDLRQNWDPANGSESAKGIGFRIKESSNDDITIGFDTQSTSGFRAFGQGTGVSFTQLNGDSFDNALNRFEANGGILRISGDLTTGDWTAFANDGEGGTFKPIVSGTGITDIASIGYFSKNPSVGSWGGAGLGAAVDPTLGGTAGDHVLIDSITLTAVVPEPETYALLAGLMSLGLMLWRRFL